MIFIEIAWNWKVIVPITFYHGVFMNLCFTSYGYHIDIANV